MAALAAGGGCVTPELTYGSVCSGIEAASVAWEPLGFRPAWFAEVDAAASAVLAYRFPNVVNLGDMTAIPALLATGAIEAPDVLVGGTPCQGFSVAGARGGLSDPRGQLTLSYVEIVDELDRQRCEPCIAVWENVPGCLSMPDNSFGSFLAALAGDAEPLEPGERPAEGKGNAWWSWNAKHKRHHPKWPVAGLVVGPARTVGWIVRDAQYFGLAQRRRRVFVVASALEGFDPGAILFELDRVRRDSPPRRETGEGVAGTLDARATGGGFPGTDGACSGHVVPAGPDRVTWPAEVTGTLDAHYGSKQGLDGQHLIGGGLCSSPTWWDGSPVSQTLDAVLYKGQTMPEKNRFPAVLQPMPTNGAVFDDAPQQVTGFSSKDYGADASDDLAPTLRASGHAESHANGGSPPAVAYSVMPMNSGKDYKARETDVAQPLMAGGPVGGNQGGDYILHPGDVLPFDTTQVTSPGNYSKPQAGDTGHPLASGAHPPAVCVTGSVTHTLKAEGFDASEDGTGRGQPITVCHGTQDPCLGDDLAFTMGRNNGGENVILAPTEDEYASAYEADSSSALSVLRKQIGEEAVAEWGSRILDSLQSAEILRSWLHGSRLRDASEAFRRWVDDRPLSRAQDPASITLRKLWECGPDGRTSQGRGLAKQLAFQLGQTLPQLSHSRSQRIASAGVTMAVRRLLPMECERLMGFPDDWTRIPVRHYKQRRITKTRPAHQWDRDPAGGWWLMAADGPRYKQLGNSMAVPVMRWLGARIRWWLAHREVIVDLIA